MIFMPSLMNELIIPHYVPSTPFNSTLKNNNSEEMNMAKLNVKLCIPKYLKSTYVI